MKHLSDYMDKPISTLLEETGAFFAFSKSQFDEKKKDDVTYVSLDGGMICPKDQVLIWNKEYDKISIKAIKQDLADHGKEKIIIRELYNHESFYTGEYADLNESLSVYDITSEEIKLAYYKELPNSDG